MKTLFFLSTAVWATASAQNTAIVNQHGSNHDVTVVQEGVGNTSIINQSNEASNRATISQSGRGNTATIIQGAQTGTATGQSVSVSQSGNSETVFTQTNGTNSIHIHQHSTASPAEETTKKSKRRDANLGRKRRPNR